MFKAQLRADQSAGDSENVGGDDLPERVGHLEVIEKLTALWFAVPPLRGGFFEFRMRKMRNEIACVKETGVIDSMHFDLE